MQPSKHSRTAYGMAVYRAAHQLMENGSILRDPFALKILGPAAEEAIKAKSKQGERPMRMFMAFRSQFAEENLAAAVERGMTQAVILGAGLDTFALRNPHPNLTVFEVDYPATQQWKRQCLNQAGLALPPSVRFAPADFEHQKLSDVLAAAGFDATLRAFFIWLGVTIYLTQEAFLETLEFISTVPASEVVFDYSEPLESYPLGPRREGVLATAKRMAEIGEPWLSFFDPAALTALLHARGFCEVNDLDPARISARFSGAVEWRENVATHLLHARRFSGAME
jgi:methyltransferase (TIGR00027 family)